MAHKLLNKIVLSTNVVGVKLTVLLKYFLIVGARPQVENLVGVVEDFDITDLFSQREFVEPHFDCFEIVVEELQLTFEIGTHQC
jgi:hypothetical protein